MGVPIPKLNREIITLFKEYRSNGSSPKRIAGMLGIHFNTFYAWIKKGEELYSQHFTNKTSEQIETSLFNKDELFLGSRLELYIELFLENEKQTHIAADKLERKSLNTGNPNILLSTKIKLLK